MPEISGFFDDIVSMAMRDVNWREIAQSIIDDWMEEYNNEESEA